jgi:hypothetical protein
MDDHALMQDTADSMGGQTAPAIIGPLKRWLKQTFESSEKGSQTSLFLQLKDSLPIGHQMDVISCGLFVLQYPL